VLIRHSEGIQERIVLNYYLAMLHVCINLDMPLSRKNIAYCWVVTPCVFESSYRRQRNIVLVINVFRAYRELRTVTIRNRMFK